MRTLGGRRGKRDVGRTIPIPTHPPPQVPAVDIYTHPPLQVPAVDSDSTCLTSLFGLRDVHDNEFKVRHTLPTLACPTLACPTLPWPALAYPGLPYPRVPALPYLIRVWIWIWSWI